MNVHPPNCVQRCERCISNACKVYNWILSKYLSAIENTSAKRRSYAIPDIAAMVSDTDESEHKLWASDEEYEQQEWNGGYDKPETQNQVEDIQK